MYAHVLTETNHAIRHPVLFCNCGGPNTANKSKKKKKYKVVVFVITTSNKSVNVQETLKLILYLCWDRAAS